MKRPFIHSKFDFQTFPATDKTEEKLNKCSF